MSLDLDYGNQYFAYFGYGSLVNRATLSPDIVDAIPATLMGWQRHWQSRPLVSIDDQNKSKIALLSVHKKPKCEIEGLLVIDRIENLESLDQRELHYQKCNLSIHDFNFENTFTQKIKDLPIHVYVANPGEIPDDEISLLQSYLDVVLAGYKKEFGDAGVERFLETTSNFNLPIFRDRSSPIYPRHLPISPMDSAAHDKLLRNILAQ